MLTTLFILGAVNGDFTERKGEEVPGENGWARLDHSLSRLLYYNKTNINQEKNFHFKKSRNEFF